MKFNVLPIALCVMIFAACQSSEEPAAEFTAQELNNQAIQLSFDNPDSALSLMNQAIAQDKESVMAYGNKATLLMNQERFNEALAALKEAIRLDSNYAELLVMQGIVHERLKQGGASVGSYRRALAAYTSERYDSIAYNRDFNVALLKTFIEGRERAAAEMEAVIQKYTGQVNGEELETMRQFKNEIASYQGGGYLEFVDQSKYIELCIETDRSVNELRQAMIEQGINVISYLDSDDPGIRKFMLSDKFRDKALIFGLMECE